MLSPSKRTFILSLLFIGTTSCYSVKSTDDSADSMLDANVRDSEIIDEPSKNTDTQTETKLDTEKTIIEDTETDEPFEDTETDEPFDSDTGSTGMPTNHRPVSEVCDNLREYSEPDPEEIYDRAECTVHADCDQGYNGRCTVNRGWPVCTYDVCFQDSDCDGGVCLCGGNATNRCITGNCQIDEDCGLKGFCSPSFGDCGAYSGVVAYYCHTPEDECFDNADCGGVEEGWGAYCAFNVVAGRWMCSDAQCVG